MKSFHGKIASCRLTEKDFITNVFLNILQGSPIMVRLQALDLQKTWNYNMNVRI